MKIKHMHIQNFRSLRDASISFRNLTVLIGENDSGKSSILDVLEIVLDRRAPDGNDYFESADGNRADRIVVELTFDLETQEASEQIPVIANCCHVRVIFSRSEGSAEFLVKRFVHDDSRLEQDFSKMRRPELDDLIEDLDISLGERPRNMAACVELLEGYKQTASQHVAWTSMSPADVRGWLPRYERYRAIDYQQPENMVRKTLHSVFVEGLHEQPEADKPPRLRSDLRTVERETGEQIAEKVRELLGFVRRYNPKIQDISFDSQIDFQKAFLGGEFLINDGRGFHHLSRIGDGTKRRVLMAVLEWDSQILETQAEGIASPLIRGYDEPDTNLHYDAQRLMFKTISRFVTASRSPVQAIVCTHSPVMIDRAPAKSINLLRLSKDGTTRIETLRTDDEQDIEEFLDLMASELGITNTALFYERCYLIVEGTADAHALAVLYKRLHRRTLVEDGIKIVDIEGYGAKRSFLKLLSKNRQHLVLTLLDSDTCSVQDFTSSGFEEQFRQQQIFFIGTSEFEDAFPDDVWCLPLNRVWPRSDERSWNPDDIAAMRTSGKKFSKDLCDSVYLNAQEGTPQVKKPTLAYELARDCPLDRIPQPIHDVFKLARQIAKVETEASQ